MTPSGPVQPVPPDGSRGDLSKYLLAPALVFWAVSKWLLTTGRYFGQDEFESMHQGWLLFTGALQFKDFHSNHPPLFFELLSHLNRWASDPVGLMELGRLVTLASAAAQLALLYPIARAAHGARAARWTLIVYATCATYLEASTEIRTDALMLPLFFGAVWLLLDDGKMEPRWRLLGIGLLMGTAFWANQKIVYQAIPMAAIMAWGGPRREWRFRDNWIAVVAALVPTVLCLGSAWADGNLSELFRHNFGGAAGLMADDPYAADRIRTLRGLPDRDLGYLLLGSIAFGWSVVRFRHLSPGARYLLVAAGWAAATFFLTPGPFPYYLLGVLSLVAGVLGGFLAAMRRGRPIRAWIAASMIVTYIWTPAHRVWKFRHPTNGYQKEVLRIGTALTEPDTPVFDGAGLLVQRPDAYGFHWILWMPELRKQRAGQLPPLIPQLRRSGARLVIWNYRLSNLAAADQRELLTAFAPLWGPLRVPGWDSLDRKVGDDPEVFELWYDGHYEVSPPGVLIDGKAVGSPTWLTAGRHTASVPTARERVIVRDATHRGRVSLPPEPRDPRFFGRYNYHY